MSLFIREQCEVKGERGVVFYVGVSHCQTLLSREWVDHRNSSQGRAVAILLLSLQSANVRQPKKSQSFHKDMALRDYRGVLNLAPLFVFATRRLPFIQQGLER